MFADASADWKSPDEALSSLGPRLHREVEEHLNLNPTDHDHKLS
jgi:hypothetical protein